LDAAAAITVFDVLVCIAVVLPFTQLARHRRAIPLLPDSAAGVRLPSLSVVLAARDEAPHVERSLRSLLAQDYPELEIIAVDDRSRDGTPAVLSGVAKSDTRVVVLRVHELPAGWLGKNHALWRGAERARGEWLLFTDADVVFATGALRRALSYAVAHELDHLTLAPLLVARSLPLRAFVAYFAYAFIALWGAYRANDRRSGRGVGIGAFNLVRRSAYEAVGTMRAISLRPDDDIRLGRRLRAFGFRQRMLNGRAVLSVAWYPSLGAAVSGLEKSMYPSVEYRVVDALIVVAFIVATMVWPFIGVALLGGVDRVLLATAVLCLWLGVAETYRQALGDLLDLRAVVAIVLFPFSAAVFAYTVVRSMFLAETVGLTWRGTVYPLSLLRTQSGLEGVPPATMGRAW
jgi:glycosyltransferase involved in cell wall biosynthesis